MPRYVARCHDGVHRVVARGWNLDGPQRPHELLLWRIISQIAQHLITEAALKLSRKKF